MEEPKKEITLTRTFDAPIERVWNAWTDVSLLKQWWGPNNVTIPECKVDLRVGGTFYIVMEAGEGMGPYKGTKWPMQAEFTVVEPTTHLTYKAKAWTEGQELETTIEQTTDITFAETEGKTTVTVTAAILKAGPAASMAVQGMEMGFNQQLDKLATFVVKQQ